MPIAITVRDLMDKGVVSIDAGKRVAEAVALTVCSKVWSHLVCAHTVAA